MTRMSEARRVFVNTLVAYLRFLISLAVNFALIPYVILAVGTRDYGLWTLTFSVLGVLSLVDFGFTTGVVRFVAEAKGARDPDRRNRVASTIMVVYLGLAVFAGLVVAVLSLFYGTLFGLEEDVQGRARLLLWILGGRTVFVSLPFIVFKAVLFGEQHIAVTNLIQIGTTLLYGGAAFGVLWAGSGIVGLAIVNLGCFFLEYLAYAITCYRLLPDFRLSFRHVDLHALRLTTSVSLYQGFVNIGDLILMRADPIIIQAFIPSLHAVALYGVALKVAENALLLLKQGVHVLGPLVAHMKGRGEEEGIRFVILGGTKFTLAPGIAMAATAAVFGNEALIFWVGSDFGEASVVLGLLMAGMALMVPTVVAQTVFTMTGLHKMSALLSALGVLTNVGLSVALVGPFGLEGVALGTLVSAVFLSVLFISLMMRKYHGIGGWEYGKEVFWPTLWPGLAAFGVGWVCKTMVRPEDLFEVLLMCMPSLIVYGALFVWGSLTQKERATFFNWFFLRQRG